MIIPNTHHEHHTLLQRCAHRGHATLHGKLIRVSKGRLLRRTETITDIIPGHAGDLGLGVGDDDPVLDVESVDGGEGTGRGAVGGEELSHDGEGLGGVDCHGGPEEGRVAHAVGVEIAAVGVAEGGVAGVDTAIGARACCLFGDGAGVTWVGC